MDEIFDRIKFNFNKKNLKFFLIVTEILGIIVLLWFLRAPLSEKYFTASSSNYALWSMKPNIRYVLKQGDFITGKTQANTRVYLLLYPSGSNQQSLSDADGNFSFQIPPQTITKEYQLLVIQKENQKLGITNEINVRVITNNKLTQLEDMLKPPLF